LITGLKAVVGAMAYYTLGRTQDVPGCRNLHKNWRIELA
jgi:hypothetical protein